MNNQSEIPWADLHCHTSYSDGSLNPEQIILNAQSKGLQGLCITDHDTIKGYEEAIAAAFKVKLHLGTGVEFSSHFEGYDIHILGYDFNLHSDSIRALCSLHQQRRRLRNEKIIQKLQSHGFHIQMSDIENLPSTAVGRPHIASVLLQKGYVRSIKEAFNLYLGERKSCYVRVAAPTVDETLDVIHAASGKAFLAHPHLLHSKFPLQKLLEKPLDGLECFYARMSVNSNSYWKKIASSHKLLTSGGSDFHGMAPSDEWLGSSGVDETTFYQIFNKPLV